MLSILQSIVAFIVALGILITFHEFGHFWVARRCGVKILRFSIGFGKPIYKRLFGPDKSEFVIAALPLGGYVKMLDEREGEVLPEERDRAFNYKPIAQRIAIVIAGPMFNFIFAVFAYWLMFVVGITGLKPVIDTVQDGSLAMQAGIRTGDEIVKVDDQSTPTWTSVIDIFADRIIAGDQVKLLLKSGHGSERYGYLDLGRISVDDMASGHLMDKLGIKPKYPALKVMVKQVLENGAAARAGFMADDQLLSADGVKISNASDWVKYVQQHPEQPISIEVLRAGQNKKIELVPQRVTNDAGDKVGRVGIVVYDDIIQPNNLQATQSYSIGKALLKGVAKTYEMAVMTLRILGKMVVGEASVKNLSGPISIAQYAGESAGLGLAMFLGFMAIVSVSLGVLNLLPIPILDGGHLLYFLIELVKGSPVSEAVQIVGQQVGVAVLIGLMGIAFYNDIIRLVG